MKEKLPKHSSTKHFGFFFFGGEGEVVFSKQDNKPS